MFGGHVDDKHVDYVTAISECVMREINEELGVTPSTEPVMLGVVTDPLTPVGRLHIGIVFDLSHNARMVQIGPQLDSEEFVNNSHNVCYQMMSWKALAELDGRFDPWSTLFLQSFVAQRLLRAPRPIIREQLW
jgi:predicted NUDIX family phosphoesterase